MINSEDKLRIKVNEDWFEISAAEVLQADILQKAADKFHIIKNHRSVNLQLLQASAHGKITRWEIEGETFDVQIQDALEQMLENMGFNKVAGKKMKEIRAPMPGLVVSIAVNEGQQVKEGDKILILEAMKMENSIIIHADATIRRIAVKAGQAVDKGQLLVELA